MTDALTRSERFKGTGGEGLLNGPSGPISNTVPFWVLPKSRMLYWNEWLRHNEDQEIRSDGYRLCHLCGQFVKTEVYEKAPFLLQWTFESPGDLIKMQIVIQ